jgi:hypothetical protein
VPRRDCSARCGYERPGSDHHAAGRIPRDEQDVPGERPAEASARLDRGADDDELGATLCGHARDVLAEAARPRPDDLAAHGDPVGARHRGRRLEPFSQLGERALEVGVQRQLALEDGRRDEHDPRAAVGRKPAGEVERVLGLLPLEQRDDDAAVGDRLRPQREAPRAPAELPDVRHLHRSNWYGTEARITFGSTSRSRFT